MEQTYFIGKAFYLEYHDIGPSYVEVITNLLSGIADVRKGILTYKYSDGSYIANLWDVYRLFVEFRDI